MSKRVVVTGLGPICSLGMGQETFWSSIISGKSGTKRITLFDPSQYSCQIGAEVTDFNPSSFLDEKLTKRTDRFSQFGLAATKIALDDSDLEITKEHENSIGVLIGSGIGGLKTLEDQHLNLINKGPSRVSPFLIPIMISNMASGQVSILTGAKGFNSCVATACSTANHAIGDSFEIIKRGDAKAMITGGAEAAITPLGLAGFCSLKALSSRNDEPEKASRPFDAQRDGFVMGEGAGILILEELEHALDRGIQIYAEIVGYGATADAHHITAPDPEGKGAARAMELALKSANLKPEKIDYINAHGTSTRFNDEYETLAIKKVFGDHAYKLAVSSSKSMTGHLLGAAGGIEAIATTLAVKGNICPPTINYEYPDPECDLHYVPNKAETREIRAAISNSFGFGGHNAVIAFKKYNSNQ